jgi:hypothetical protein
MSILNRVLLIVVMLAVSTTARSDGIGAFENIFGGIQGFGGIGRNAKSTVVPACVSPNAPNGVFDLSLCSNASYVVIFPL